LPLSSSAPWMLALAELGAIPAPMLKYTDTLVVPCSAGFPTASSKLDVVVHGVFHGHRDPTVWQRRHDAQLRVGRT